MFQPPEHLHFERSGRTPLAINVTPLIDCVFLLLVFFMLTTSFLEEQAVILHVSQGRVVSGQQIVVDVDSDGRITLQGEPVALEDLTDRVRPLLGEANGRAVSIRAKDNVPVQATVTVMDKIRDAGSENIKFLTRRGG